MLQIGKAVGEHFTMPGETMLVGWDPRESSGMLVTAMTQALSSMAVDIKKVGVIPTPGLAYLTKKLEARAGVMITASHNPYTDNGVKIFTSEGKKLPDDAQNGLNTLIEQDHIAVRGEGSVTDDLEALKIYENFLLSSAGDTPFKGLRIAVDSANGATSGIAARVFERLGTKLVPMFDKPDGKNINVDCGATDTNALRAAVQEQKLDAGVAFDGDGDRVMLIDEKGRELTGDHILYILAIAGKQEGVVATIMSNRGLEKALEQQGIGFKRTDVGDRSVLRGLAETGFTLGGEQSGHIIIPDYTATGDGILAAIRTLSLVIGSGKTLGEWYDELRLVPQALVNIDAEKSLLERPEVQKFIEAQTAALGPEGRLNIRPSGTEPKVRIMVEAADAPERARKIAGELADLLKAKA